MFLILKNAIVTLSPNNPQNTQGYQNQIFEARFPKQFLHPINKSHTFGKFQETPKVVRAKLHNLETPLQWTNCWSISSPLCLPQHQSTIISPPQIISCKTLFPILMQLSKQRKQLDMKPLHHICFFFFFFFFFSKGKH